MQMWSPFICYLMQLGQESDQVGNCEMKAPLIRTSVSEPMLSMEWDRGKMPSWEPQEETESGEARRGEGASRQVTEQAGGVA